MRLFAICLFTQESDAFGNVFGNFLDGFGNIFDKTNDFYNDMRGKNYLHPTTECLKPNYELFNLGKSKLSLYHTFMNIPVQLLKNKLRLLIRAVIFTKV